MRKKQTLAATLGVVAALLVGGWYALDRMADGSCSNAVIDEALSPDGALRLVAFQRDCGATTGFSTQISLLKRNAALPNDSGNVFIADTDHGDASSGPGGGPEVRMRWDGPKQVTIQHHARARVFLSERIHEGVALTYVASLAAAESPKADPIELDAIDAGLPDAGHATDAERVRLAFQERVSAREQYVAFVARKKAGATAKAEGDRRFARYLKAMRAHRALCEQHGGPGCFSGPDSIDVGDYPTDE